MPMFRTALESINNELYKCASTITIKCIKYRYILKGNLVQVASPRKRVLGSQRGRRILQQQTLSPDQCFDSPLHPD